MTIVLPTTIFVTHYVDVPVTQYVNVTYDVNNTETRTIVEDVTESEITTLYYTDLKTQTDLETMSITKTDLETVTDIETDSETITKTEIDSETITKTAVLTSYDPCPTTCSVSVETVNLYFWPTDRPYSYPSTYVDTASDYTFVSPSVYMFIPTARGTNSLGPAGPSTTNWMLPLDLSEVSTIIDGSITRQLTLSDLGTDCPQSANPTAIATLVDSRCDPVLAAPKQVSSWAYPCNACGHFGLFDPPYAFPPVTGGLVQPTPSAVPAPITTVVPPPIKTIPVPVVSSPDPGTSEIVYPSKSYQPTNSPLVSTSPASVMTASATRLTAGHAWLVLSSFIMVCL